MCTPARHTTQNRRIEIDAVSRRAGSCPAETFVLGLVTVRRSCALLPYPVLRHSRGGRFDTPHQLPSISRRSGSQA
jgi:hypothetical protein